MREEIRQISANTPLAPLQINVKKLSFWRRIQIRALLKFNILISKISRKINRVLSKALYRAKASELPTWYCRTIEDVIEWWVTWERKRSIDTKKSLQERWKFNTASLIGSKPLERIDWEKVPDTPLNSLYREITKPGIYTTTSKEPYGKPIDKE